VRVLVLGATGFIGSAISARLAAEGHEIIGISRDPPGQSVTSVSYVAFDVASASQAQSWLPLLAGVHAVVNCAGTLQDAPGESTEGVHFSGIDALFAACEIAGIRRVVHLSAVGVERETSAFSHSKHRGDAALMTRNLDWVILRPSVVFGRAAYGGSALLRGLAALPLLAAMPGSGPLQIVWLDDLVATVVFCLRASAPARVVLEVVGPRRWSVDDLARLLRRWLRWPATPQVAMPVFVTAALYRLGDAVSWLGWRPPVRSTARREIVYGAIGDARSWWEATGIVATDLEAALAREPASVQERWFAQLYMLKPLVFGVFGLFWLATGIIALGPGWENGMDLMREGGVAEPIASLVVIGGASADLLIGLAILYRPTSRSGLIAALVISLAYAMIGSILVPRLWSDPLGPMLKIWPVMVLNLVALAIRTDR
jgi:uncharacterized protein YbjT (DUF2867 family)